MVKAIDLDAHVIEPWDLWSTRLEPRFRDCAPRAVQDSWGARRLMVESQLYPTPEGPGRAPRRVMNEATSKRYNQLIQISQDTASRLEYMDQIGIDKAVLLPSQGLVVGAISDPELAAAVCRTYNDWLWEFCSSSGGRLIPAAMVALQSPTEAVKELERASLQLGFRAAFIRPNPVDGRNPIDPAYYPLFALCEERQIPILLHEGCGYAARGATVGINRFENGLFSHVISHPFEQMLAILAFLVGGILERFPRLKVGVLEAGCGWLPYWLHRLDEHCEQLSWEAPWLTMSPSSYFRRQCIITCDPSERGLAHVLDECGESSVAYSSDFPHADHISEAHVTTSSCLAGLNSSRAESVLYKNAADFLGLQHAALPPA